MQNIDAIIYTLRNMRMLGNDEYVGKDERQWQLDKWENKYEKQEDLQAEQGLGRKRRSSVWGLLQPAWNKKDGPHTIGAGNRNSIRNFWWWQK